MAFALHRLPVPPCTNPPRDFTERAAKLAALKAAIEEGATIAGLWGMGGIGKTVLHDQRALLLMDNAAGARQVAPLIPPAGCLLLVTSRQHFTLPGLCAMNLEALLPQDARDLLLTIASRIGDQADALAGLCGYLPLALRLTASALAARIDLSPADHLRRWGEGVTR